eukprot:7321799-Heterocapsa_arctica.AAC.1
MAIASTSFMPFARLGTFMRIIPFMFPCSRTWSRSFAPAQVKSWASRDAGGDSDHFPVFADIVALQTPA